MGGVGWGHRRCRRQGPVVQLGEGATPGESSDGWVWSQQARRGQGSRRVVVTAGRRVSLASRGPPIRCPTAPPSCRAELCRRGPQQHPRLPVADRRLGRLDAVVLRGLLQLVVDVKGQAWDNEGLQRRWGMGGGKRDAVGGWVDVGWVRWAGHCCRPGWGDVSLRLGSGGGLSWLAPCGVPHARQLVQGVRQPANAWSDRRPCLPC